MALLQRNSGASRRQRRQPTLSFPSFFSVCYSYVLLLVVSQQRNICLALSSGGGGGMMGLANELLRQSPSSTTFVTNKKCPYAQKVWIALETAKVPYQMKEIDLYGPNGKPDWFMEMTPFGTIPALSCFGGAMMYGDSDVILDNLNKLENGGSVVPSDDQGSKQVAAFRKALEEVLPVGKKAVLEGGSSNQRALSDKLDQLSKLLKKTASDGPFVCGKDITIADCAAFPFVWRLRSEFGEFDETSQKDLTKWLKACEATATFSNTIAESWWWWW